MTNAITITRKANTVHAPYLPYAAYQNALALATALKGKIGETADKTFKATFNSVKTAEKFVTQWTADYNANRKVSVEPTKAPTVKPKASKGNTKPTATSPKEMTAQAEYEWVYELARANDLLNDDEAKLVLGRLFTRACKERNAQKSSTSKTDTKKTSAPKKSTTSSKKAPRKSKGNAFDYSVIKGKTNADKNKALHKELVKMGHKDSRTPEYMSIWNARPWAK